MADPRFFRAAGPFSVADLARLTGAEIAGAGNAGLLLKDVAPLETAGPAELSFLSNRAYVEAFAASQAGAAFVGPDLADRAPAAMTLLVTAKPYVAYARAAQAFYPRPSVVPGVASSAVVDPAARLGADVSIGHHAVVGAGAEVGEGSEIGANSVIGPGVVIGNGCRIGANVTISHCLMGDRVTLYPGVRIGQDGFGFAPEATGHIKIPQLGRVIIGDDVEVGANVTIDRGAGPDTVIGSGSMIDNLVQIAHNVVLGRHCVVVAQAGISGSTRLADGVMIGGQAGLTGHLSIGSGARIAAQSGVTRDVPAGGAVGGSPAVSMTRWLRQCAALDRIASRKDK